jgi:hypothetical protein
MDRAAIAVDNVSDVVFLGVGGAQDGIAVDQYKFDHEANDPNAAGGGMHHESAQLLFPLLPVVFLESVLQQPRTDDPLILRRPPRRRGLACGAASSKVRTERSNKVPSFRASTKV